MSASLSENELSDSNGLFSNNKGKMYTSDKQGGSTEDEEDDFSLFAALEMVHVGHVHLHLYGFQ